MAPRPPNRRQTQTPGRAHQTPGLSGGRPTPASAQDTLKNFPTVRDNQGPLPTGLPSNQVIVPSGSGGGNSGGGSLFGDVIGLPNSNTIYSLAGIPFVGNPGDGQAFYYQGGQYVPVTLTFGTVTSVGVTTTYPGMTDNVSNPTTTPAITLTPTAGLTANQFVATPNGSTGAVVLRNIASADLPVGSSSQLGALQVDGTTITAVAGVISAAPSAVNAKASCFVATTAALPTNVYNNGASGVGATLTGISLGVLTVDGQALTTAGTRLLVKDEAAQANIGIYTLTTPGSVIAAYVLTRATDLNQSSEFVGAFTFIEAGSINTDTGWICGNTTAPTVGTTAIIFNQFNSGGGGTLSVTDGITTVNPASSLNFTSGATISNLGGGTAGIAISGGSGLPTPPLTKPVASDYVTWVNQSAASVSDGYSGMVFTAPNPTSNPLFAQVYSSVAFSGLSTTFECRVLPTMQSLGYFGGIALRESSTTKALFWCFACVPGGNGVYLFDAFTGSSQTSAAYQGINTPVAFGTPWIRMRIIPGGTPLIAFEVSGSGEVGDWSIVYSATLSTYFTTYPDQLGFCMDNPGNSSMCIQSARQY